MYCGIDQSEVLSAVAQACNCAQVMRQKSKVLVFLGVSVVCTYRVATSSQQYGTDCEYIAVGDVDGLGGSEQSLFALDEPSPARVDKVLC